MAEEFVPIQMMQQRQGAAQPVGKGRLFGALTGRVIRPAPESATLAIQTWLYGAPWRITGGWVMLAGLISVGIVETWQEISLQRVLLLWLLVDPLWGALWRLAGGRSALLPLPSARGISGLRLPYLQPGSPAAQLLALDESNALPCLFRIGLPTLAFACLVALALGRHALLLTLAAAVIAALGWAWRRTWQRPPLLMQALITVGLPWSLALWEVSMNGAEHPVSATLAMAFLWTVHHWGELRGLCMEDDRIAWIVLGIADFGLVVLLIVAQAPFWLPVLAVLALPTWLALIKRRSLAGLDVWWLAALLLCAVAIGQRG